MEEDKPVNFIEDSIKQDLASGRCNKLITRFPPEPNGCLHLGHAKSIYLNFTLARTYKGMIHLRFDDTNPTTEKQDYAESIKKDIRWLGFQWDAELYVSDYFEQLYQLAVKLIRKGMAYVDDSTSEELARLKGTPTQSGTDSPYRDRSIEENLTLFEAMKNGLYEEGTRTLRAKITMTHANMLMRDPVLYRIKYRPHARTENQWCIYPVYDFAHGQSDAIEKVTHSLCTLEFIPHRELYEWLIEQLELYPSKQYEFARLNMTYTVMSKRRLLQLVEKKYVNGWDDPRLPTLGGMRRRGYTAKSIVDFCEKVGVTKRDNLIDVDLLEFCIRNHLNQIALRRMVVLNPLKIIVTNYPEGKEEWLTTECNPEDTDGGRRDIPFSRTLYIEREDFMETPPKKFFRLTLGKMVRLKSAYIIRCDEVIKDTLGQVSELRCTYISDSKSGSDTSGLRVKGVLHWVCALHYKKIQIRLYDRLFTRENMNDCENDDFISYLNKESLQTISIAYAESALHDAKLGEHYQFLRMGYFFLDPDSTKDNVIMNRTVTLRNTWEKRQK